MGRILLVRHPYEFDSLYLRDKAGIPLRTAYLAAILENNSIDYDVLDLNIESIEEFGIKKHDLLVRNISPKSGIIRHVINSKNSDNMKKYLSWIREKIRKKIKHFDYICINGDNPISQYILKVSKIENENIKRIVGGSAATTNPHPFLLNRLADYICLGHADKILPLILKNKEKSIPNVIRAKNQKTIINHGFGEVTKILTPSYKKIKLRAYLKYFNYAPLISSFGCYSRCHFCSYRKNIKFISRDLKDTIDEINMFKDNYNIKNFIFYDNCINNNPKQLEKLCDILTKEKTNINWMALFRPSGLSEEFINKISSSGCIFASFGIENPRKKIQNKIGKNLNIKEAEKIIRIFKSKNIHTRTSFMYGLPNETLSDFFSCFGFAKKCNVDSYYFFKLALVPRTDMFDNIHNYFPYMYEKDGKLTIIHSRKEIIQTGIKQMITYFSNLMNRVKWDKYNKQKRFHYTDKFLSIKRR